MGRVSSRSTGNPRRSPAAAAGRRRCRRMPTMTSLGKGERRRERHEVHARVHDREHVARLKPREAPVVVDHVGGRADRAGEAVVARRSRRGLRHAEELVVVVRQRIGEVGAGIEDGMDGRRVVLHVEDRREQELRRAGQRPPRVRRRHRATSSPRAAAWARTIDTATSPARATETASARYGGAVAAERHGTAGTATSGWRRRSRARGCRRRRSLPATTPSSLAAHRPRPAPRPRAGAIRPRPGRCPPAMSVEPDQAHIRHRRRATRTASSGSAVRAVIPELGLPHVVASATRMPTLASTP